MMPAPHDDDSLAAPGAAPIFLQSVFEHASCGFALLDAALRVVRHNAAFEELTGVGGTPPGT